MDDTGYTAPEFLTGAEVAQSRRLSQPGFDDQLSLLSPNRDFKKKLVTAIIVILSVFLAGMIAGAVLGIFV